MVASYFKVKCSPAWALNFNPYLIHTHSFERTTGKETGIGSSTKRLHSAFSVGLQTRYPGLIIGRSKVRKNRKERFFMSEANLWQPTGK